ERFVVHLQAIRPLSRRRADRASERSATKLAKLGSRTCEPPSAARPSSRLQAWPAIPQQTVPDPRQSAEVSCSARWARSEAVSYPCSSHLQSDPSIARRDCSIARDGDGGWLVGVGSRGGLPRKPLL